MASQFTIYVYGSCYYSNFLETKERVGPGGFGVVITSKGEMVEEFSGGFSNTTNARMDLMAIKEAISRVSEASEILIYLSNGYIIDTFNKGWLEGWKKRAYKKVSHADLWKQIDKLIQSTSHTLSFEHSKAIQHTNYYERVQELAKQMSRSKNLPSDLGEESDGQESLFSNTSSIQNSSKTEPDVETEQPILDSICVDASCIGNPGKMEYRGVDTKTGELIFERKYEEATNNIGEFLAIVHALAHYKKEGKELKVLYSDSQIAISWVQQKTCKTKIEKNEKTEALLGHIERAILWLKTNEYQTQVLKWKTEIWGEIPADYGRK